MTVCVQCAQIARAQHPPPPNMFELRQAPVPYKQIAGTEPREALRNPHKNTALPLRASCHLFTCRPHPSHRSRKTDAYRRHPTSTAHTRAPERLANEEREEEHSAWTSPEGTLLQVQLSPVQAQLASRPRRPRLPTPSRPWQSPPSPPRWTRRPARKFLP